jgi:hypothetical protein
MAPDREAVRTTAVAARRPPDACSRLGADVNSMVELGLPSLLQERLESPCHE